MAMQHSFWGNYLPRLFPVHLRGTGESFAVGVGGRVIAPFAALATTQLANLMPGTPTSRLALSHDDRDGHRRVVRFPAELSHDRARRRRCRRIDDAAATPYLLDNAQAACRAAHARCSPGLFDAPTQRALTAIGIAPGWDCLEVGGGGGSVAHVARRTRRTRPASVLCTDIDPRHVVRRDVAEPARRAARHRA